MGFSNWPLKYYPVTIKPEMFDPQLLYPTLLRTEQKELEDFRAEFSKTTQHLGMQLVAAQDAYLRECALKLGMTNEELVQNYELESRLKDPVLGGPRPVESNDYKIVYEFRLVPRVDRG